MTISSKTLEVPFLNDTITAYTAHLEFKDYDKIFMFLKWKCPVEYKTYRGGSYMSEIGIEAVYSDGTSDRLSFCQIRDGLERYWTDLREMLQEPGEEDLGRYSEGIGGRETLTLHCSSIAFRTGDHKGIRFDRIWGRVLHEFSD